MIILNCLSKRHSPIKLWMLQHDKQPSDILKQIPFCNEKNYVNGFNLQKKINDRFRDVQISTKQDKNSGNHASKKVQTNFVKEKML